MTCLRAKKAQAAKGHGQITSEGRGMKNLPNSEAIDLPEPF